MLRRMSLIVRNVALAFALVALAARLASAQSAAGIAGVVKDATGGVLPGVTVEASSPALPAGHVRSDVHADGLQRDSS